ncbi:MAG: serine--tRNA ligase, partial [Patescibacteria group bacterium]|nr:serine--tRNA ligase [Patescibacteria group bacterium]
MLDINFIRENPDQVKQATKNKGYDPKVVDEVLTADKTRREQLQKIEA